MKVRLKDIKKADADYSSALMRWGENNQITVRADIYRHELKKKYEQQKNK